MGTVHLDAAQLRRIAERLLGDREFDYLPELNKAIKDLQGDTDAADFGAAGNDDSGFIHGISQIGTFHASCMDDTLKFFTDLDRGLVAMSNVLASVAESFTETDVDSAASTSAILQLFTSPHVPQVDGREG